MKKILIVVVNYKKSAMLVAGVQSILRQDILGATLTVSILDNSCDSREAAAISVLTKAENVRFEAPSQNIGYVAGVNKIIRDNPSFDYYLLMSPDIRLEADDILSEMLALMHSDASIGVLAPTQLNEDNSIPEVGRKFPRLSNQLMRRIVNMPSERSITEQLMTNPIGSCQEVDWVQSSFCLVRGGVLSPERLLDARYFLFMADVELCLSAWRGGSKVLLMNLRGVRADGVRASGGSLLSIFKNRTIRIHAKDALTYYATNALRATASRRATAPRT